MAIRNIVKKGDDVLKKTSRTILTFDEKLAQLLDDMAETMYQADGCGLAAVQVGILKRVCIVDVGEGIIELVNPVVIEQKGVQHEQEGCLSVPGIYEVVERPKWVKVRAQDRFGKTFYVEGEDLKARALCHEIDHLNGTLFTDKIYKG